MCRAAGRWVDESMTEVELSVAVEFRTAMADARARVASLLEPACPNVAFLNALRAELANASADATSVPYPELLDPDTYWKASVNPQAKVLRHGVIGVIEWLQDRVIETMELAETELKQIVDFSAANPGPNMHATRTELRNRITQLCDSLHQQMAELLDLLPDRVPLDEARAANNAALTRRATVDVEGLENAYLREAGGDDAHQTYAAEQWSETFADRVAHRQALLAGASPWRHQELALISYESTWQESESLVDAAVTRLQAPLSMMQQLLMERFDELVS
ncbi:MAG: hypothetical protein HOH36_03530 [Acidimicrobiaceae bacterium]|jgi:hypothetical protein|nr:hypothetical protein [Acidimicrobiaceae bacterium]